MLLADAVIIGVVVGAAYALMSVSLTLMLRTTGVLSFAHAAFAMLAAYTYSDLSGSRGWPVPLAAGVALVVTVAYGLVIERVAMRRIAHAAPVVRLIGTLGVLSLTIGLVSLVFGSLPVLAPFLFPDRVMTLGSLAVPYQRIGTFAFAVVSVVILSWFLQRTRFGIAIRAMAQDPVAARLMGVSPVHVAQFNWVSGAFLAGVLGVLVAPLAPISVATFPLLLVKAFTGALLGGLFSLPLAFVGGIAVGVVETVITVKSSVIGARELGVLAMVLVLLVVRRSWVGWEEGAFFTQSSAYDPRDSPSLVRRAAAGVRASGSGRWTSARYAGVAAFARPFAMPAAIVAGVLLVVVPARSEYWAIVGGRSLFYTIEALSLVLLVGWGGQVSLMHGAYVGAGVFMMSWLSVTHGVPLELAIPAAAFAGMLLGAIVGLPALRLSGLQFAIASLAFSGAAVEWLFHLEGVARNIPRGHLFGIDLARTQNVFMIMLVVTALCYVAVWNIRRSVYGAHLIASRDAPSMAGHFGIKTGSTRIQAFLFASFMASIGGAFFGILISSFNPVHFSLQLSIALLLYTVIGGAESLAGPVLAGIAFGVLPELLQRQSGGNAGAWPDVIAGAAVLVLLVLCPRGLASIGRRSPNDVEAAGGAKRRSRGRFEPVVSEHARISA